MAVKGFCAAREADGYAAKRRGEDFQGAAALVEVFIPTLCWGLGMLVLVGGRVSTSATAASCWCPLGFFLSST